MRITKSNRGRIAAGALAIAALVAVTALISTEVAGAADAARRAPRATHVGVAPSDFVVLSLSDPKGTPKFVRSNSDGTVETEEFVVPEGSVLVVTDVDYSVEVSGSFVGAVLRVYVENTSSSARSLAAVITPPDGGSGGLHAATASFQSGFVVESGARVVADMVEGRVVSQTDLKSFSTQDSLIVVRGYLTTDS
jgi:hypothetical protein